MHFLQLESPAELNMGLDPPKSLSATTPAPFQSGIRQLSWHNEAKLMSSTLHDGGQASDAHRKSAIHHRQQFIVRNNSTFWDHGENTIYEASVPISPTTFPANAQVSFSKGFPSEEHWCALFHTKIVRDGSIIGYDISDVTIGKTLLKVHDHANTLSSVQRTFKAFFWSPVKKWDVKNSGAVP